jgi:hypothetical protein
MGTTGLAKKWAKTEREDLAEKWGKRERERIGKKMTGNRSTNPWEMGGRELQLQRGCAFPVLSIAPN